MWGIGDELFDAREFQDLLVRNVVILERAPHRLPAVEDKDSEPDQLLDVISHRGKGLAHEASCFPGAEWLVADEDRN